MPDPEDYGGTTNIQRKDKDMTKRELINTYLNSVGKKRISGDTAEPLVPFLLGDAIYSIYNREIAHLPMYREDKKLRNEWAKAYSRFNRPFFRAFDNDASIEVTDLMDDFEDYISDEIMMVRSQLMLIFQDMDIDTRTTFVSILMCHILAQCAQYVWGDVYRIGKLMGKTVLYKGEKNMDLDVINRNAFQLARRMHRNFGQPLVPGREKGLQPALDALCRKIYKWLEEGEGGQNL